MTQPSKLLSATALALLLGACGGGGGGSGPAFVPAPPPTPTPTPTPTPSMGPILVPGVTTTTDFAVMGYELDGGDTSADDLATDGFSVRYDHVTQTYLVGLPSYGGAPPSTVTEPQEYSETIVGLINGAGMNPAQIGFRKPSASGLQYSNVALVDVMISIPMSVFAFGLPTPAGAVPVSGNASYLAALSGASTNPNYDIGGSASFNFDFASGALSGSMEPFVYDLGGGALGLGTYTFSNTVFSVGSTTFSGFMANGGYSGSFSGLFTGPGAEELIGRFNGEYRNPDTSVTETMFGAFAGARSGGP